MKTTLFIKLLICSELPFTFTLLQILLFLILGVFIYLFMWAFIDHFFDVDIDAYLRQKGARWVKERTLKRIEKQNPKQNQFVDNDTIDVDYEEYHNYPVIKNKNLNTMR